MARQIDTNAVINWIRSKVQASNPAVPDANYAYVFVKADGLYLRFSDGTVAGPFGTNVTVGGAFALAGDISPSQITAHQNDYNPTGLSGATALRLSSDASRNLTGLAGGADGRLLILHNVGAQDIVLKDEDAASAAANRFALTGDVTLMPDTVVALQYDATSARWRVIGGTGGGGGVSDGDKGDITVSGGGATWTIDNNAVTFAKMQALTDGRLLGASGGTAVEEITVGAGLQLATNDLSSTITQYTDELAQDAVGGILTDTATIDFTYDDATPQITADVKDDAVTYAKMQNVSAASKLLGRGDSGSGDVQEITLGTNLTMSGTTLNAGGTAVDSDAIHDNVSGEISVLTEKVTLHNDDLFLIEDSEASNAKKKVKKSNVGGGGGAPTDATYVVEDAHGSLSAESVLGTTVIETAAFASLAAAAKAGRLKFPNDSFYILRDSGSLLVPWGPIFPMTQPIDGDFAWVNQGGAAVDATYGGIYLTAPSGSTNHRMRKKSAPATPYTITIACMPWLQSNTGAQCGVYFRESGSGKLSGICIIANGGYEVQKWNSPSSFSANYTTLAMGGGASASGRYGGVYWLQISDDGSNRIYRASIDGQHWLQIHSVGRTDFLTADEVAFSLDTETGSTVTQAMLLLSWKQS